VNRYFTEVGIGCIKDERDAIHWFRKAAEHGDKRAITRLRTLGVNTDNLAQPPTSPRDAKTSTGRKGYRISSANVKPATGHIAAGTPDQARPSEGVNGKENKRRSRRNTLPGLMGMTNKEERPPLPDGAQQQQATNGKKGDGDCIIS
jgi:TPR repeat protein